VLDHLGLLDHLVRVLFGRDPLLDMPAQVSLCISLSLFLYLSLSFSPLFSLARGCDGVGW
jgi:hypothetical protein